MKCLYVVCHGKHIRGRFTIQETRKKKLTEVLFSSQVKQAFFRDTILTLSRQKLLKTIRSKYKHSVQSTGIHIEIGALDNLESKNYDNAESSDNVS